MSSEIQEAEILHASSDQNIQMQQLLPIRLASECL